MPFNKTFITGIRKLADKYNDFIDPSIKSDIKTGNISHAMDKLIEHIFNKPTLKEVEEAKRNNDVNIIKRYNLALEAQELYLNNLKDIPKDFSSLWFLLMSDINEPVKWSSHII